MSLRSKLLLLCALSLGLAIIPILSFAYFHVRETLITKETSAFIGISKMLEDNLNQRYAHLLSHRAATVMVRKSNLKQIASYTRDLWAGIDSSSLVSADVKKNLFSLIVERMGNLDINMALEIIGPEGRMFSEVNDLGLSKGLKKGTADFKGRPLSKLITDHEEFAVLNLEQADGGIEPVLAFFLQVPDRKSVIVSMLRVTDVESTVDQSLQHLVSETRSTIRDFNIYKGGFISILDSQGRVLAHHGAAQGADAKQFPPNIITRAQTQGGYTDSWHVSDAGSMFVSIQHFKALGWTIVFAAPIENLEGPPRDLVKKLLYIAMGAAIIVLLLSLSAIERLTRPLLILVQKIRALPDMDFASQDIKTRFTKELPLRRKDELGQVARAFALMARRLSSNVRDLMEATAVKERMQGELNAAKGIQRSILPQATETAPNANFSVATLLEPAKEVGGDLYDFFTLPSGKQVVVIGDVSDKGVPAALFMSMTVTLIRSAIHSGLNAAQAMTAANNILSANNSADMFVTLVIGIYDPENGQLLYANGGHCSPIVCSQTQTGSDLSIALRTLDQTSGPVVGALPNVEYTLLQEQLQPGDLCFLYTDGVSEAINEKREFFMEQRIMHTLESCAYAPPTTVLDVMYKAILSFRQKAPQSDDIAMLAFTVRPYQAVSQPTI